MPDEKMGFSGGGGEEQLPEEVRAQLRRMYEPVAGFDGGRDAGILAAARAAGGRGRGRYWRWVVSGAVAAAVMVAVGTVWVVGSSRRAEPEGVYVRTGDVRDAFYVAREIKKGRGVGPGFDENRDGKVDGEDVGLLAMAAVRVDREGGTR